MAASLVALPFLMIILDYAILTPTRINSRCTADSIDPQPSKLTKHSPFDVEGHVSLISTNIFIEVEANEEEGADCRYGALVAWGTPAGETGLRTSDCPL